MPIIPSVADTPDETLKLSGRDKRRFQRFDIGMPVLVRQVVNEAAHALMRNNVKASQRTALVKDISMTGLYFLAAVKFAVGDVVELQMTLGARTYKINALIVRVSVHQLPGRESYGAGVQYVKSPAIDTVLPAIANYLRSRFKSIGIIQQQAAAAPVAAAVTTQEKPANSAPAAADAIQKAA